MSTVDTSFRDECALLASLLRKCARAKDLAQGTLVHGRIAASHHHSRNRYLGNLIVQMYGSCGSIQRAVAAFESIDRPNVFSWTVMITAYAQNGYLVEARELFDTMPDKDVVVWNVMLKIYSQNGLMVKAREIFDAMPQRDVVSWTALVSGHARNGDMERACSVFARMPMKNLVSWNTVITVYAQLRDLDRCKAVFDQMPERDAVSWNALISAYAQNGHIEQANKLFDSMPFRKDTASWNVMLAAYGEQEMTGAAFRLLASMDLEGTVQADRMTFVAVLQAAASAEMFVRLAHDEITLRGMESDTMLSAALVSAYARCGLSERAKDVFDRAAHKNTVSWTAMIATYTRAGRFKDAVRLFSVMDLEGVPVDGVAVVAALEAFGRLGELEACRIFHHSIVNGMEIGGGVAVGNGLVSMYAKCGGMEAARSVFDGMRKRDIVTWNAAVAGYAKNGQASQAFELFRTLELESIHQPNEATFSALLLACSHGGFSEDGCQYFGGMKHDYGVAPAVEHCISMVDLLGRLGLLEQAEELLLNSVECERDGWVSLISACKLHKDAKLAAKAAGVHVMPESDGARFVLMQNTLKMDATS
ncbi:pentatricopeptide repeat-containing protein At4g02750-like [Selaginella moellendorffii]|uniref:pentatricopeptide repeat-containing protein At4g02750-like n=1 Tax=Selaginella moellendorffii TaxID=88036 RepID=UPI000D1CA19F|nr:pentatricopeptide repeat-containing protein At4g02750-like [Selaginella moellendorffii]|eukprot:XP_024519494.1 pentatricopeptide repeat-containing protein At4g02750-like [Selaginella moellendorffii]